MKKFLALILAAALCLACASCRQAPKRYQATFLQLFDTVSVISGFAEDKDTFTNVSTRIYDMLLEYHKLFDIYNTYEGINNIKTINDNAGVSSVKVDRRIIDMLSLAVDMYRATGGKTNVAMGSVLKLWHDARESGIDDPDNARLPDAEALSVAALHMDIDKLVIDADAGTVYLADKDMSLDVGAIGKGYAVEMTAKAMQERGLSGYILSIGGNVRAIGAKADGTAWKIGIENPLQNGDEYLMYVGVEDMSVVTSGSYQRYYTVDGKQYHHIIDPDSLYPQNMYLGVTIVGESSAIADALSTALFSMDEQSGKALIESMPGYEAVWCRADGTTVYSEGFETLIIKE